MSLIPPSSLHYQFFGEERKNLAVKSCTGHLGSRESRSAQPLSKVHPLHKTYQPHLTECNKYSLSQGKESELSELCCKPTRNSEPNRWGRPDLSALVSISPRILITNSFTRSVVRSASSPLNNLTPLIIFTRHPNLSLSLQSSWQTTITR